MWKKTWKYVFIGCAALYVAAAALLWTSPTPYKVDFDAVLEIWGDVVRDIDNFTKTATRVSVEKEIEVGDSIASSIWFRQDRDASLLAYINGVGQRIAAHARRRDIPYKFHVVEARNPNAFAIAGGHIYVTTGLLDLLESEAQLAAVIGHEIAHVDLRHCIELLQYELLLRRAGFGDLSILVSIAEELVRVGYSEVMEREADRLGLLLAVEAGYAPLDALRVEELFYEKFEKELELTPTKGPEGEIVRALSKALEDYFGTHPQSLNRLDEMRALLDQNMPVWEGDRFYVGTSNHRERISRVQDERADEFVTYSASAPAYLVARAKIARLVGRTNEALRFYTDALEKDPLLREAREGRAEVYLSIGKTVEALNDLNQVIKPLEDQLGSLNARLNALPTDDTEATLDVLDEIIDLQIDIRSVRKSRASIMEDASDPSLASEKRLSEEISKALLTSYERRGELLLKTERFEEALAGYQAMKTEHPDSMTAIKGEIFALKGLRHYVKALHALSNAVARFPEDADFLRIRAEVYDLLGRERDAVREMERYRRFIEDGVPPLTDEAWSDFVEFLDKLPNFKAMAIGENGRYRGASSSQLFAGIVADIALKECAREAGRDCALYALGEKIVWGLSDDELESSLNAYKAETIIAPRELSSEEFINEEILGAEIKELTKAIEIGNDEYLLARANRFRKLRRYQWALKDVNAYIIRFPNNLSANFLRGTIYLTQREYDKALVDFRRVTLGAPESELAARSHAKIAEIYLQHNNYARAVQEYESAILPESAQPILDKGMCLALARRALPAAALPFCETAVKTHRGKDEAQYYDARAFVFWQLRRTWDAKRDLVIARQLEPWRPHPETRLWQFRVLIVEIFLRRMGYNPGYEDGRYDSATRSALMNYFRAKGIPYRSGITDNLVGQITPLGFGGYRIETVYGQLTRDMIKTACAPATKGEFATVRDKNGVVYICNSDGVSVRRRTLPRSLDYESRDKNEWLRCYDPNLDIVFSLDPNFLPPHLLTCGGNSYRISDEDYWKLLKEKK